MLSAKYLKVIFILPIVWVGIIVFGVRGYGLDLSAETAVLLESDSNTALYCKNAEQTMTMASTTKIMTALLMLENANLNSEITVTEEMAAVEGTSMGLLPGDRVSVRELVYGMLLPSGNDAANTAAYALAGSIPEFANLMNEKAVTIGMTNTHFVTPSGLDAEGHYSTAYDMALLGSYAIKNREFFNICSTKSIRVDYGNPPYSRTLTNHNKLLSMYDDCIGIKTGFTKKSGRCLVSAAERDGVTLIAVTLNASDDWNDHIEMFEYGFSATSRKSLDSSLKGIGLPITGGNKTSVSLKLSFSPEITVCETYSPNVVREIYLKKFEYAPISAGTIVGEAVYIDSDTGKKILTVPIVTAGDVETRSS